MSGKPDEAVGHYRAYLERAHRRDPRLAEIKGRITALSEKLGKP